MWIGGFNHATSYTDGQTTLLTLTEDECREFSNYVAPAQAHQMTFSSPYKITFVPAVIRELEFKGIDPRALPPA